MLANDVQARCTRDREHRRLGDRRSRAGTCQADHARRPGALSRSPRRVAAIASRAAPLEVGSGSEAPRYPSMIHAPDAVGGVIGAPRQATRWPAAIGAGVMRRRPLSDATASADVFGRFEQILEHICCQHASKTIICHGRKSMLVQTLSVLATANAIVSPASTAQRFDCNTDACVRGAIRNRQSICAALFEFPRWGFGEWDRNSLHRFRLARPAAQPFGMLPPPRLRRRDQVSPNADLQEGVVRLGMGLLATMAAPGPRPAHRLGQSQYDAQRDGLDQIASKFVLVDDAALAQYGPDAGGARDLAPSQPWHPRSTASGRRIRLKRPR